MEYKLNHFRMGLTGTHRTGKTTLAEHVASRIDLPFIRTDAGAVFKRFRIDPSQPVTPLLRLEIQEAILEQSMTMWDSASAFVTDRTPFDFISYLLMDYDPTLMSDELEDRYIDYINRCFTVMNATFSSIVLIPQGLPIIDADWKGIIRANYMDKQEMLIRGCLTDRRNNVTCYSIDGKEQELEVRGDAVIKTILKNFQKANEIRSNKAIH